MVRGKRNIFYWSMGLVTAVTVLCLVGAVGKSYARYQVNRSESIFYTADQPAQVFLGQMIAMEEDQRVFQSQAGGSWEQVEDHSELAFAVANGTAEDSFAQKDQLVQLRLIGSLGVWNGQQTINVTLLAPNQTNPEETQPEEIPGQATRIDPESPLYSIFGDGWLFTFPDENGEERSWLLEGEKLSALPMRIRIEGVELTDPSLLQLTVTGAYLPDNP